MHTPQFINPGADHDERQGHPLTGRTRFRFGEGDKLILQVQYAERVASPEGPTFDFLQLRWRDGRVQDLPVLTSLVAQAPPSVVIQNTGAPIEEAEIDVPGSRKPN